jgi:hypothetical protein
VTSGSSVRPTHNPPRALKPGTPDMQRSHPTRAIVPSALMLLTLGVLLAAPALMHAQFGGKGRGSTLPSTGPTPPPVPPAAPIQQAQPVQSAPTPTPPSATPARRADVTYANGLLSISANNSSLNQILREISRQTGMKITGGVTDERVFGAYGPASPSKILATLLDGTGSNMILVQSAGVSNHAVPMELVLTPRHGGPTPPNPSAPGFNDRAEEDDRAPQTISNRPLPPPPSIPVPAPNAPPSTNNSIGTPIGSPIGTPIGTPIAPDTAPATPPAAPPAAPPTTPADPNAPTTQDQSPNGVKTPQQIYDQLLKLRQQPQPTPPNP